MLPSETKTNPRQEGKEHYKAISLKGGKEIEGNPKIGQYEKELAKGNSSGEFS